jgi:hypothetical protein
LAKFYSVNPVEFLRMPLDEVDRHMYWTAKVVSAGEAQQRRSE